MRNVVTRTYSATDYITLAQIKTHLRVTSSDDDTYIGTLLNACFDYISNLLGYEIRKSTVDYFFSDNVLHIPARILSITSVHYRDTNGDLQAWTDYDEVLTISANYGYDITLISEPDLYAYGWKYKVTVVEGFGKSADSVDVSKIFPDDIRHAIYLLAEHLYANRGSVLVGVNAAELPINHNALISKYSIKEFV